MDSGRATPARRNRWFGTVRELVRETIADGAVDAAASVAFWLLLSLPATLLAGLAALSMLGDEVTAELRRLTFEFVDRVFTSEADDLRRAIDGVFDQNQTGLFSISIVLAVVTASRGFAGMIRALDVVYDIDESRGFVHLRVTSIGLALGTIATIAASTYLWQVASTAGLPTAARVAGALVMLVVWAATIFHIGPNHHTPWRYDLPGAFLVAVGWMAVSAGFGLYIRFAGGSNQVLGLAGALLFGMTWVWLVCLVLLVGGELNEIIARRAGVVSERRRILPPLPPLPTVADVREAVGARRGGGDDD
jgi:membrane protein